MPHDNHVDNQMLDDFASSANTETLDREDDHTLSGRTTIALREAIIKGDIAAGTKLNEPKLAEEFNVSRGPLREAIRRLVAMHLVRHVPHQGARVITLEAERIMELYDIREALEGKAAALAARNMSVEQIDNLKKLLQMHAAHADKHQGYMAAEGDFDFHYQVIKGSGNRLLTRQLCDELYHLIRMFRYQTSRMKTRTDNALTEHQQLVYAIEQRDEQMAEMVMRHHIARARRSIAQYLETVESKH